MVTYDVVRTEVLYNTAEGLMWFRRGFSAWLLRNFGSHKTRGTDILVRRLSVNTSGIQRQLLKIDKFNHTWKSSKTATLKWNLTFTRRWGSRLRSARMCRRVVQYIWSSASGKPVARFRCSRLPRNVGAHLPNHTVLQPERPYSWLASIYSYPLIEV
jgi:hypothetical protein